MNKSRILGAVLVGLAWMIASPATKATTYDLAGDWSTTNNPNGVWSFNQGSSPLPYFQVDWWLSMDGWASTETGTLPPAWLKMDAPEYNAETGDIVVHSSYYDDALANVTWTSPSAGVIDISGQVWDVLHYTYRDDEWSLLLNGTEIAYRNSVVGVSKNSSGADFANNLILGQSLNGLVVNPDDVVTFQVHQTQGIQSGHFSGLALTIELTPVPVPAAVYLFGSGLLGLIGIARRRKSA